MQQTEKELDGLVTPTGSKPETESATHLTLAEADDIFKLAEAEIQPLLRQAAREKWTGRIQAACCLCLIVTGLIGTVSSAITYPHTLVVLYAKAQPAAITTTLDVATRTLAPVTITRSATSPTTGTGHQDAKAATGTLIFYNGSANSHSIPVGSVFTGNDGVKVTTEQSITVPAANLPAVGRMSVGASALLPGSQGNIAAFDVNADLASVLKVKNEAPFTNGQDARTYQAVAHNDLAQLTSTVNQTITQALTTAFPVQPGEKAVPTICHTTTTPTHQVGDEATHVTVTTVKTCAAVAYASQELDHQARATFIQTRPGAQYHLVGSVQTTLKSVAPLSVTISGTWAYTFTPDYEQCLAQEIQGETPAQARKALLRTGIIAYVSIPTTLPPATYINFLVLVG